MKLLRAQVHQVLGVQDIDLNLEGTHLALVGGKNGNGKSSALIAIACAICGRRAMGDKWPDILLKEGEDEGWVKLNLSGDEELHDDVGFTVEMLLRRKRGGVVAEEIRVLDSTGEEAPTPRELLSSLYHYRGFDPLEFAKSKPKDQAEMLRKLLGLDFTELDEERKEKYAERTAVNRDGKEKAARLDAIAVPDDTPDESLSVRDLFLELEHAQTHNREAVARREKAQVSLNDHKAKYENLKNEQRRLQQRLKEIEEEFNEEEQSIALAEKELKEASSVSLVNESEIQCKISGADAVNRDVAKKRERDSLSAELESLRQKSASLSNRIKAIDDEKQKRLEDAEWPLPGLSIDEDGVLLNGLPFEQASKSQQITASVRIGMKQNPKLKLLISQDGNDLDNEALTALEKELKDSDYTLLLEFVTRSKEDEDRCVVVLEEGKAKNRDKKSDTQSE